MLLSETMKGLSRPALLLTAKAGTPLSTWTGVAGRMKATAAPTRASIRRKPKDLMMKKKQRSWESDMSRRTKGLKIARQKISFQIGDVFVTLDFPELRVFTSLVFDSYKNREEVLQPKRYRQPSLFVSETQSPHKSKQATAFGRTKIFKSIVDSHCYCSCFSTPSLLTQSWDHYIYRSSPLVSLLS
jgi:hypothetical protein